jgi:hypothetical protein
MGTWPERKRIVLPFVDLIPTEYGDSGSKTLGCEIFFFFTIFTPLHSYGNNAQSFLFDVGDR